MDRRSFLFALSLAVPIGAGVVTVGIDKVAAEATETLTIFSHDGSVVGLLVVDNYVTAGQAHVMRGVMFIAPNLGARLPPPDSKFTASGHSWPAWALD